MHRSGSGDSGDRQDNKPNHNLTHAEYRIQKDPFTVILFVGCENLVTTILLPRA
jgi:hypothetical protein